MPNRHATHDDDDHVVGLSNRIKSQPGVIIITLTINNPLNLSV